MTYPTKKTQSILALTDENTRVFIIDNGSGLIQVGLCRIPETFWVPNYAGISRTVLAQIIEVEVVETGSVLNVLAGLSMMGVHEAIEVFGCAKVSSGDKRLIMSDPVDHVTHHIDGITFHLTAQLWG